MPSAKRPDFDGLGRIYVNRFGNTSKAHFILSACRTKYKLIKKSVATSALDSIFTSLTAGVRDFLTYPFYSDPEVEKYFQRIMDGLDALEQIEDILRSRATPPELQIWGAEFRWLCQQLFQLTPYLDIQRNNFYEAVHEARTATSAIN